MSRRGFSFGKNWDSFVNNYLNEDRVAEAEKSLREFLCVKDLCGRSFLDVGCGSGLFSLAACRMKARTITSFDIDPASVRCCEYLRQQEDAPSNWRVEQGSILDDAFISQLPKHDIVYSWGVLHHTGSMWKALERTASVVADKGMLYIAIYNRVDDIGLWPGSRFGSSRVWGMEKALFSKLPGVLQDVGVYAAMAVLLAAYLVTFHNPARKIREHKRFRGMSWKIDIKDWLGGYPYECASVDEVFRYVRKMGFSLENLKCGGGLRNNEYLFVKR